MKPWYRIFIYLFTLPWDLISWFLIFLIWLFWGTNLKWERDVERHGSFCLTTDLKPNSWPARTWYTYKVNKKKQLINPSLQERYGKYRTWSGTTLGPHAIFYGPGVRQKDVWSKTQKHENVHSEQGEAYMVFSFISAVPYFSYGMVHDLYFIWIMSLVCWTLGYVFMISNFFIAFLRGEKLYRGSHHEEAAYSIAEG